MKEMISISKDKLVLLSKLLKEVKNSYRDIKGKELLAYKYQTQRKMIETLFNDEAVDLYIDKLKDRLKKVEMREQAKEEL